MVLFTVGAILVGAVVVGVAFLNQGTPGFSGELRAPGSQVPAGLADGRTLGKADAPVTVEIWSDFQCPACDTLAQSTEPSIITSFVIPGQAKLVYHDAAFQGQRGDPSWDESVESAAAARCAADQGKFWEMHDWLFANRIGENEGGYRAERLRAIAERAGLDMAAYDSCMAAGDKQAAVKAETEEGLALGIDRTPTLIVNGIRQTGALPYDQLSELIRTAAEASPAASTAPSAAPSASVP